MRITYQPVAGEDPSAIHPVSKISDDSFTKTNAVDHGGPVLIPLGSLNGVPQLVAAGAGNLIGNAGGTLIAAGAGNLVAAGRATSST